MQFIGKGKALRPGPWPTLGANAIGALPDDEEVYVVPGRPTGVSPAELKGLPEAFQELVMETWFRANFCPSQVSIENKSRHVAVEIAKEFGGISAVSAQGTIIARLIEESRLWERLPEASSLPLRRELGNAAKVEDAVGGVSHALEDDILHRLAVVEAALGKLAPLHGGIGHNNSPEGPLIPAEHAEALDAVADIKQEAKAARPDVSRVQRAAQVLSKAAAAIGAWIWKRVEVAADEIAKKSGLIIFGDAMNGWQALTAVIDAVGYWISRLSG